MAENEIYQALAAHLDAYPQGFPATQSRKELEILAYLFSPEEAQFALHLSLAYTPMSELVEQAGISQSECQALLKSMTAKGLINMRRGTSGVEVSMPPFVVGFYESQVHRMDATFAQLFEDYYQEARHEMLAVDPQLHRVVPVNASIKTDVEILPEEQVSTLLSRKKAWAVIDCICRKQKALLGQACDHPLRVCLVMSDTPGAFDNVPVMDAMDLESALQVLDMAAQAGLVHTVSNRKGDISYVCNCCTCSCALLRGIAEAHMSNVVARSAYFARVDEELCIGCGECEAMCQFNAISIGQVALIDRNICTGCGVCTRACPEVAITLKRRPSDEIKAIPDTVDDWLLQRSQARGLD